LGHGGRGQYLLPDLDGLSFHKNDILKQKKKKIAGSERGRRHLKYCTNGKGSARLVARNFDAWEEGKAGKDKVEIVPVLFFLTEHHAMKACRGVEV
jgi:hypothetical protein